LKKPQAIIGLLAALGTVLGVMVAVIGLPYGRFDGTAFASDYHQSAQHDTFHFALDCDTVTAGLQDDCTYQTNQGPFSVNVEIHNESGTASEMGAMDFLVRSPDDSRVNAVVGGPGPDPAKDANPDQNQAAFVPGTWSCTPPPPSEDINPTAGIDDSLLSCFESTGTGPNLVDGSSTVLGTIYYTVPGTATPGDVTLTFIGGGAGDPFGTPLLSCPGSECLSATIHIIAPPPATATFTPTPLPPTATPTNTPDASAIIKFPETCLDPGSSNCGDGSSNLFLCETGPCAGAGEGNLIVFEYALNVATGDQNGDTVADGLGAYEFSVEYDNFVISSVNPTDVVFSTGITPYPGGWDGVLDGEGASRGPANCSFSIVTENIVHFGCVTTGPLPAGPTGNMDIARLNLIPHEDLADDIFPGNNNGVVTIIKDNGCELVDVFGHPTDGSVNGGLTPICGNLSVTVRILEGDLNLDCTVDVADQQLIGFRYGAFFGSLLYNKWYDLEPALHDLDIDIKDIQKVFGRDGSTCQNPIPAQPPA
jgi:hypothetical protein